MNFCAQFRNCDKSLSMEESLLLPVNLIISYVFLLGVHTAENRYTSPILCVHLQRYSQRNHDIHQNNRTLVIQGTNAHQGQGPQQMKTENNYTAEEEIVMIPVEDVSEIIFKIDTKKGKQQNIESKTIPEYGLSENCCDRCWNGMRSCYSKIKQRCCCCCQSGVRIGPDHSSITTIVNQDNRNRHITVEEEQLPVPRNNEICDCLRCWCCRKKKLLRLVKRTETVAEQRAQRVVMMTIEYSKYSNLDSASNARLLSQEQQATYYKDKFEPNSNLEFYLISNTDIDATNFNERKREAEVITRTVLHLKALRNHYPSETELERILNQTKQRTFGDVHEEPIL